VGAKILPLPQISHGEILSRALREEKPFRIKGDGPKKGSDGYRDMLMGKRGGALRCSPRCQ
jgi:hypothetical protein